MGLGFGLCGGTGGVNMSDFLAGLFRWGNAPVEPVEEVWHSIMAQSLFAGLNPEEIARLRILAGQMLTDKAYSGAGGLEVSLDMATVIAAYAALPILNLGYDWYKGWDEIIVYPAEFIFDGEQIDEAGVVHHDRHARSGEAGWTGPWCCPGRMCNPVDGARAITW